MGKKFKQRNGNVLYRIIEGTIINVQHAHPKYERLTKAQRNSICKRAQGTLLAYFRQRALANNVGQKEELNQALSSSIVDRVHLSVREGERLRGYLSPLRKLQVEIGKLAREARLNNNQEQLEAYIRVLRLTDSIARNK